MTDAESEEIKGGADSEADERKQLAKRIPQALDQIHKPQPKSLRDGFMIKHGQWIKLLNYGVTPADLRAFAAEEPAFELWQVEHKIWGGFPKVKFPSRKDFVDSWLAWMRENLKHITRGEWNELKEVGNFTRQELNSIFSEARLFVDMQKGLVDFYVPEKDAMLANIKRCTRDFLEYIHEVLNGGLQGKAKFGIFKVGVCPYCRKNKPECGIVFVGAQWNSEACEKHAKKWKDIRYLRENRQAK